MIDYFQEGLKNCQLSGLEDVVINDFIKDDLIADVYLQEGLQNVLPSFLTQEPLKHRSRRSEREQNEREAFDAVGEYGVPSDCLSRMCLNLLR